MRKALTVSSLTEFGRVRLSTSFFMRDFLYSDIAAIHGLANVPNDPDLAIAAGIKLCEELLEPIQSVFGRIAVRSAYRSAEVNGLGSKMMKAGKAGYNCARNEENYAAHIWDRRDKDGHMGATACIVVPGFYDRFQAEGDWRKLAWWIHDHLPCSSLFFFQKFWAFNINWHEKPERRIDSFVNPRGCLTKPGMPNHGGSHEEEWRGIVSLHAATAGRATSRNGRRSKNSMVPILQEIVDYLNREKVRATYGAVAEAIGVPAQNIGRMLGGKRPEASWIVGSATELPTGYAPSQYHPDLCSRPRVIRDGNELREAIGLRKR